MADSQEQPPHPELVALLNRLQQREGSFRRMSRRAGVRSADTFARVARGDGTFSEETARKLADAYGEQEGFTYRQLAIWARLPLPAEGQADDTGPDDDEVLLAEAELGRLVRDARSDFPDDEDYRLFRDSVLRNARAMRELARRKGRGRGDGG